MSRDYDELKFLADLEDPQGENFVPADYNTQDMRDINEKVNRILYGESPETYKKPQSESIDVSKMASASSNSSNGAPYIPTTQKMNEISSYSSPELRQAVDEEAEDFILDINKNTDDTEKGETKGKNKTPRKKKITIVSIIIATALLVAVLVLVIQAVVMPEGNVLSDLGIIDEKTEPVVIADKEGHFIFAKGCEISGVNISGMTINDAREALKEKELEARPQMNIKITVNGDEKTYTEDNFTFSYDTNNLLKEEIEFSKQLAVAATYPASGDKEKYNSRAVREISASLNESSVKKLVSRINKKYDIKTKDARATSFDPGASDMFKFKEGEKGRDLDEKSLQAKFDKIIESGHKKGKYIGTINEETQDVKPKASVSYLKKNMMLLAEWTTVSTNDASANQNMDVSLKACNGSIIDPGEVWSFNSCTGNSNDPANGYAPAGVIVDGSYTNGYGGGICQSSTTIYNAAVRSNLEIYERHNHTYPSVYAYSGFDAAIDYGNFDLKLKNNSKYQVFLECYMKGTTLTARFYGIKSDSYDYIDTSSENYEIASSYYKAHSYRIYKNSNGEEIDREQLPDSYYSLQNGHSVQTADPGGSDYEHNKKVYSGDIDVEETTTVPPTTKAPKIEQARVIVPETKPTQTKPAETQPKTKPETKPQSSSSSKPQSSSSSKPENDDVSSSDNEE